MEAQQTRIAKTCLDAAYAGSTAFPAIVATLIEAGFEGYVVDYRRHSTTYFLPDGDSVLLDNPTSEGSVAAGFDAAGVAARVKRAQDNPPDYSYAPFCENLKASGCAGYMVSFPGRRALYVGRTAETHVEHFTR